MTITELIPAVQGLSHADKLLLLQVLVQELINAEGISHSQGICEPVETPERSVTHTPPIVSEQAYPTLTLDDRRAFLNQSLEERRRLMSEQAKAMEAHYTQNSEWQELMNGDIIEY